MTFCTPSCVRQYTQLETACLKNVHHHLHLFQLILPFTPPATNGHLETTSASDSTSYWHGALY